MVEGGRRIPRMETKTLRTHYSTLESLGMHQPAAFTGDGWYEWLINEYIPAQGKKDLGVFLDVGGDVTQYILWKMLERGKIKSPVLAVELRRRYRDVHGVCDLMKDGKCRETRK